MKSYKTQIPFFLFCYFFCFTSVSISAGIFLNNFLDLYATLSGKYFGRKFSFFNGFPTLPPHHHLYGQICVTKAFCQFSLKCLLKYIYFFKYLFRKSCKSIFYVSAMNCYFTYIFKVSNNKFSGVLFRTCFKNSYIDTSISNFL